MAVIECKLSQDAGSADFDQRNLGTYKTRYKIKTNSSMGPRSVANGALLVGPDPLPSLWSSYAFLGETDNTSYLRSVSINRRDKNDRLLWLAECEYRPMLPGEVYGLAPGTGFNEPLPWNRPPVWDGDAETYTKLIEQDKDGNAILNAAGRPFNPTLEREESRCVAVAVKNYQTLDDVFNVMQSLSNAVNEQAWRGRPARSVWCSNPSPLSHVTEGVFTYYPVAFRFSFQELGKTWDDSLLELGYSYLEVAGDEDSRKDAGAEPVLLAANGTKNAEGVPPVYSSFRTLREVDFASGLGF